MLSAWWISGAFTLEFIPRPLDNQPPPFVLGQQTFIIITIVGQIIPLVLMSPSFGSQFGILALASIVIFGSYYEKIIPLRIFAVWNSAQLAVYFILAAIIGRDERRFHVQGLIEQEAKEIAQTARLAEQRAKEEAQEAKRRVTVFVGSLSHDVRQPLFALGLKISVMRETITDPEFSKSLQDLDSQVNSLANMLDGTLDLAKFDAGVWKVNIKAVILPDMINEIVLDLAPSIERAGLILHTDIPNYVVLSDPEALSRSIRNLLNNSIRYTPKWKNGVTGKISIACHLIDSKRIVRISLTDNGIGIPEDKLDYIFTEFAQIGNSERNREKGFGLGLSIVRAFAESLKAASPQQATSDQKTYGVSSKLGEGSCFWIDVPFSEEIGEARVNYAAKFQPRANTLTGVCIALVEDDVAELSAFETLLRVWGCSVIAGASSREVIKEICERRSHKPIDLIISDLDLPGETGLEAIAAIRTAEKAHVPAMIWTGKGSDLVPSDLEKAGIKVHSKGNQKDFSSMWELIVSTVGQDKAMSL